MKERLLILEDGSIFKGYGFGSDKASNGKVAFTTGMTGYQEVLSNPSNDGQILMFTYPLIGNYGINNDDFESLTPGIHGMVIHELSRIPSNFRSNQTLDAYLSAKDIPGIEGIDTRRLTRILRSKGELHGMLTEVDAKVSTDECISFLQQKPTVTEKVSNVSCKTPYRSPGSGKRIVVIDFGMKHSILKELIQRNCDVTVVPFNTTADAILEMKPEGVLLSNGPGDPRLVTEGIDTVRNLIGKLPIFGISLGHQLISLAAGASVSQLHTAHRGGNHPVKDLETEQVRITSQNHGFSVDMDSIDQTDLEVTHIAVNDGTIEGLKHRKYPIFSVQYHPEASPGPTDSNYLFDTFLELIEMDARKESQHA